jgi:HK97 family phage portal protein
MSGLWRRFGLGRRRAAGPAREGMRAAILPAGRRLPPRRGTAEFLRAYSEMPWLRAASNKVAQAVAAVEWQVARVEGERRTLLPDHPLQRLLAAGSGAGERGVPGLTGLDVRKVTSLHLDLAGEAFWLLERNRAGLPIATLPLPPHWVADIATPARPFYRLAVPGGFSGEVAASEIVAFREIDPERPYERGAGIARALADELDTDEQAAKHVASFLANRARPDLIVAGSGEQPLSPEEAERLELAWGAKFGGPARAGRPFFSSGPLSVTPLAQSFRDSQMREIRQFERDTIVSVFGLPPEKLGILQNSNRSTIEAADLFFAKEVLLPRLRLMREVIRQRLVPEFDARLSVDFDSPVEDDRAFRRQVMLGAREHFTRNELRALAGLPPKSGGDRLGPDAPA